MSIKGQYDKPPAGRSGSKRYQEARTTPLEEGFLGEVRNQEAFEPWYITAELNDNLVLVEVDTGAGLTATPANKFVETPLEC